jgi:hypothetical protein
MFGYFFWNYYYYYYFEKYPNNTFHENPSRASPAVPCSWTEGRTVMIKPWVVFRNFANAPKNGAKNSNNTAFRLGDTSIWPYALTSDFRFPTRCKLGLGSSWMLRGVDWWLVTEVQGQPIGPHLQGSRTDFVPKRR